MQTLKNLLSTLIGKLTGRKCGSCTHNCGGRCCHPSGSMYMKCFHSITHPGYEYSESVHFNNTAGAAATEGLQAGMATGLTKEEQYQLQKIKAVLQEAGETARESGLMED